ncbi:MAG: hypothetical protein ACE5DI_03380 [Candidatus Micrarchaeia archaeon]
MALQSSKRLFTGKVKLASGKERLFFHARAKNLVEVLDLLKVPKVFLRAHGTFKKMHVTTYKNGARATLVFSLGLPEKMPAIKGKPSLKKLSNALHEHIQLKRGYENTQQSFGSMEHTDGTFKRFIEDIHGLSDGKLF